MSDHQAGGLRYRWSRPSKEDKAALDAIKWPEGAQLSGRQGLRMQTFASLQDALAATQFCDPSNNQKWANFNNGTTKSETVRGSLAWNGVEGSVHAVQKLIRDGWPEGVTRMEEALRDLGETLRPASVSRKPVWTDQGDELDIHRVWAGRV